MLDKMNIEYFKSKGLLPFQAKFAAKFLMSEERYWQFVSPLGTGKMHTAAAIVEYVLAKNPSNRILVLTPPILLNHWHEKLVDFLPHELANIPMIADRKTYLELESKVEVGDVVWPRPAVILMSVDLAKREDMARNLTSITWDLAIVDESHRLSSTKGKSVLNLFTKSENANRMLLLSALMPLKSNDLKTEIVKTSEIIDWSGEPLAKDIDRTLLRIDYRRTKDEQKFLRELQEFSDSVTEQSSLAGLQIVRAASSSLYATESILRRLGKNWRHLRNKLAHNSPLTDDEVDVHQLSLFEDESVEDEKPSEDVIVDANKLLTDLDKVDALLMRLEEIPSDTKMNALISHLHDSFSAKKRDHLCILSSFSNTVEYLISSLEDLGFPVYGLTGALGLSSRVNILDEYRKTGGIMVASDVALEGISLDYVDMCINYDLPHGTTNLEHRWGRFLRITRRKDFAMYYLQDKSRIFSWETGQLEKLQKEWKSS